MKKPYTMTVAEFKDRIWKSIKDLPDTDEISFGQGDLSVYRMKWRGDHVLNIEFSQVYSVTVDAEEAGPDGE